MKGFQLVESAETTASLVGGVAVKISTPTVYLWMALASTSILLGSVVWTLGGGEGPPKMPCLVTSNLGYLRS